MSSGRPAARFDLADFGRLVGDASRASMLLSLTDGQARPATELALLAGVSASTASGHLTQLVAGGLLCVCKLGRHRYYRLASDEIAHALEVIGTRHAPRALPTRDTPERRARTCYRHLAGVLGVALLDALERRSCIALDSGALRLTGAGRELLGELGVSSWPEGRPCLDWTERRHHLGGPLGVALADALFERRWLERVEESRAVSVTPLGRQSLRARFRISADSLPSMGG